MPRQAALRTVLTLSLRLMKGEAEERGRKARGGGSRAKAASSHV